MKSRRLFGGIHTRDKDRRLVERVLPGHLKFKLVQFLCTGKISKVPTMETITLHKHVGRVNISDMGGELLYVDSSDKLSSSSQNRKRETFKI